VDHMGMLGIGPVQVVDVPVHRRKIDVMVYVHDSAAARSPASRRHRLRDIDTDDGNGRGEQQFPAHCTHSLDHEPALQESPEWLTKV
jgi:hypothetical protein